MLVASCDHSSQSTKGKDNNDLTHIVTTTTSAGYCRPQHHGCKHRFWIDDMALIVRCTTVQAVNNIVAQRWCLPSDFDYLRRQKYVCVDCHPRKRSVRHNIDVMKNSTIRQDHVQRYPYNCSVSANPLHASQDFVLTCSPLNRKLGSRRVSSVCALWHVQLTNMVTRIAFILQARIIHWKVSKLYHQLPGDKASFWYIDEPSHLSGGMKSHQLTTRLICQASRWSCGEPLL